MPADIRKLLSNQPRHPTATTKCRQRTHCTGGWEEKAVFQPGMARTVQMVSFLPYLPVCHQEKSTLLFEVRRDCLRDQRLHNLEEGGKEVCDTPAVGVPQRMST